MELLERETELDALAKLVDELAAGRSRCALIEGPAGIGKTRLLAETRRLAKEQRITSLESDPQRFAAATRPYQAGHYLNFVEDRAEAESFFAPEVAERLREVRDVYDPKRLLQANHEIGAGS